jgi:8-oxo-dGTP diphosphatase
VTHPLLRGFTPKDEATLLFVRRGLELLLIRKKRGLGAGKINAPGGRLEPGETPLDAAIREVREEVRVDPQGVRFRGDLSFAFADGYSLHCSVFMADGCEGEPNETDEAIPMWIPITEVPYPEMWADDILWMPKMLSGWGFSGRFVFDGDRMEHVELDLRDPAAKLWPRLAELGIPYEVDEHVPLFTVEQAGAVYTRHDGLHTKNLFLRDKKGAQALVTLRGDARVDLKEIGARLGLKNGGFGSPARLRDALLVEAGSVTPLAALHDEAGAVRVAVQGDLLDAERIFVHPMSNDRTMVLSGRDLLRFLDACGHPPLRI